MSENLQQSFEEKVFQNQDVNGVYRRDFYALDTMTDVHGKVHIGISRVKIRSFFYDKNKSLVMIGKDPLCFTDNTYIIYPEDVGVIVFESSDEAYQVSLKKTTEELLQIHNEWGRRLENM